MRYEIVKQFNSYRIIKVYKAKKWWLFGDIVEKREHMTFSYIGDDRIYFQFDTESEAALHLKTHIEFNKRQVIKTIEAE